MPMNCVKIVRELLLHFKIQNGMLIMEEMPMKIKKWKQAGALVFAAAVFGCVSNAVNGGKMISFAAVEPSASGKIYDEAALARLKDNTLEFQEIAGLIEHYNPTYLKQLETFYHNPDGTSGLSRDQLLSMAADLRAEAKELSEEAEDLKKSEIIGKTEYQEYKTNISMLKRYAQEMEDAAEGSSANRRALMITKNQLTAKFEAKMMEYQGLRHKDGLAQKQLEVAELTYDSAKRQREAGLYSPEQVLTAEDALNGARAAKSASASALTTCKQELITAFGWNYGDNPEILQVPEPDVEKISTYNLTADVETALSTNYDIGDLRRTDASQLGGANEKKKQIAQKQDEVRIQFEYLYQDVMHKYAAWKAVSDGWSAVEAAKAQAQRKHSLGMIGNLEYLKAEAAWMAADVSRQQAVLDLKLAMETYEWAMKGLMELPISKSV